MKKHEDKELLNIAAELKKATFEGRARQGNDIWNTPAKLTSALDDLKFAVSIINLQSHDIRLVDHFASNVISISARQEIRTVVDSNQTQMLDREQKRGTLKYKILHPGSMDRIPPNVNLKCPQCIASIDYVTGACNNCNYEADIPPIMQ
ncbi:hypothetical protein KAR91_80175 [Candidatus Pacearchaeota archaeon]|nr:hypothetical protein [Candidatus Pacearchaeota archaeon]